MNKEKAIEILKHCGAEEHCLDYKHGHCDGCNQRIAQDMAIEALKTESIPVEWINRWYDRYMYAEVGDLLNDWVDERKEE